MLLTEDEATKKWCPFARDIDCGRGASGFNRPVDLAGASECIGSRCMAWTWEDRGKPVLVPEGAAAPAAHYVKRGQTVIEQAEGATRFDEYVLGFTGPGDKQPSVYGRCGMLRGRCS